MLSVTFIIIPNLGNVTYLNIARRRKSLESNSKKVCVDKIGLYYNYSGTPLIWTVSRGYAIMPM